jgi:hypothetical protein
MHQPTVTPASPSTRNNVDLDFKTPCKGPAGSQARFTTDSCTTYISYVGLFTLKIRSEIELYINIFITHNDNNQGVTLSTGCRPGKNCHLPLQKLNHIYCTYVS